MVVTHDEDWYSFIQEVCPQELIQYCSSDESQDMKVSPNPEQIFACLSAMKEIQEENGRCSNPLSLLSFIRHSGVVYLKPKVSDEVGLLLYSICHIPHSQF